MARVCPRCAGTEAGCPICNLPPKRRLPKDSTLKRALYTVLAADTWAVRGIDFSKWNGKIYFPTAKTKCQYGYMRLGYGNEWKDNSSDIFYPDAMAADFPLGVYWFSYIGQNAFMHAEHFAEQIALHPPQLDIVIDAETTTLDPIGTLNWLITMDEKLQEYTGKLPAIYSSPGFWNGCVARSNYFSGRVLWDANWTLAASPSIPIGWTNWTHWQWRADGNKMAAEYGSTEGDPDMDEDRYNGTVEQFNARYGTHILPLGQVTPSEEIKPIKYVFVNTSALNVRSLPSASSADIGTVRYNDDLPVVEERDGWLKIEGWVSKTYTRPK